MLPDPAGTALPPRGQQIAIGAGQEPDLIAGHQLVKPLDLGPMSFVGRLPDRAPVRPVPWLCKKVVEDGPLALPPAFSVHLSP